MADIPNTNTDGATEAPATDAPGESFDSQTAEDQGTDAGDADSDEGGDEGDQGDDDFTDDGSDPTDRRDSSYYIGLRHGKKAAKTAQKAQDDDGGDDNQDLDDDDLEVLDRVVGDAVKPLAEKLAQQEDAKELNSFLAENPGFKPFQSKIERFMKHDSRKHLPIETVAMEAVGMKNLIRLGSKLATKSNVKKASSSPSSGGGNREKAPSKSVSEMNDQEFALYQQSIRSK